MKRAVIDVGSNSVLLTVAEVEKGSLDCLHETSEVTGLGVGTKESGLLSEAAMVSTLAAVKRAWGFALQCNCSSIEAWATMATRIASNTLDFTRRAFEQGTPVQVLSGEDEAKFGFLSVVNDPALAGEQTITIIDVGGHSTEIVTAVKEGYWKTVFEYSFPIGTLALMGMTLAGDTPTGADLLRASTQLDAVFAFSHRPSTCGRAVALGASGTNLVSIRDRLPRWDPEHVHMSTLGYEEVSKAAAWLSSLGEQGRKSVPGIEKGRDRTVHIGALVLERAMFAIRTESCLVSVRGWRHGLLASQSE